MPMCIKKMQMRWIVSCLLLTLKQLTCIYYSYLSEASFSLYFYLCLFKCMLLKRIKLEGAGKNIILKIDTYRKTAH